MYMFVLAMKSEPLISVAPVIVGASARLIRTFAFPKSTEPVRVYVAVVFALPMLHTFPAMFPRLISVPVSAVFVGNNSEIALVLFPIRVVIVVAKLESSPRASAISASVSKVAGELFTRLAIASFS